VGVCVVGRQHGGVSRDHWFTMLDRPRKAVAQWHSLADHVPPLSYPAAATAAVALVTPLPAAAAARNGGASQMSSAYVPPARTD